MRTRTFAAFGVSAALAMGVAACGSDDNTDSTSAASGTSTAAADSAVKFTGAINAGGSTFAKPVYDTWGATNKANGLTFNYAGTGSGAGIAGVTDGTLDFGGSDSATDDEELAAAEKKNGDVLNIPMFFGAVTASYNVQGVETGLKLDGETLADIYLGKVKTWNDPAIADQNPGVELPSAAIKTIHRSDESGTTKAFLSYLGAYSKEWEDGPGVDKSVEWPAGGSGAKGNDGVAAAIKQTPNSIGYVEQAYALNNNFTYAALKNKAGNYVNPTLQSVSAAGDAVDVPADLRFAIGNAEGDQTYPDASATFVVVAKDLCKAGKTEAVAKDVKNFLTYGLGAGQAEAQKLAYAPLPESVKTKAQAAVDSLQCNGAAIAAR